MKWTTYVVYSAIAIALGALVYGVGAFWFWNTAGLTHKEAANGREISVSSEAVDEGNSENVGWEKPGSRHKQSKVIENRTDVVDDHILSQKEVEVARILLREQTTQAVRNSYSFLLEDLDLTSNEKDTLISLLIEHRIAATVTEYKHGNPISEEERSKQIGEVIGESKLQKLLELERNGPAYSQAQMIASTFQQNSAPLTGEQREGLLDILKQKNQRQTEPPKDIKRGTIEYLEYRLTQMDDRERLILELAPSVLSNQQVVLLAEQYQRLSYKRAHALEAQKKARFDNPSEDRVLYYPVSKAPQE